jgi:hypothetical protein
MVQPLSMIAAAITAWNGRTTGPWREPLRSPRHYTLALKA